MKREIRSDYLEKAKEIVGNFREIYDELEVIESQMEELKSRSHSLTKRLNQNREMDSLLNEELTQLYGRGKIDPVDFHWEVFPDFVDKNYPTLK